MIRADMFLFGYVKYTVKNEDIKRVAELFLKNGISVKFHKNSFVTRSCKSKEIDKILNEKVEYHKSEPLGIGGFLFKNKKRYGAISALVLTTLLYIFASTRVWDIRVEGCAPELREAVIKELSEAGLSVGSRWQKGGLDKIEVSLLSGSDTVSWINVNRRGTVAYISVIEKEHHEAPEEPVGYSNLVATEDAVIEEITVVHGVAMVKVGDSVKRGDLLISGVIPSEAGGGFCYAEGIVKGRISDIVTVKIPSSRVEKYEKNSTLYDARLNILNFSAKFYKYYRNLQKECVIIEKREDLSIFGKRLPFSILKKYSVSYGVRVVNLTVCEMTAAASSEMQKALEEKLSDATLLKIRTEAEFLEDSYVMNSSIVYTENIGADLPFDAPIK